MVQMVSHVHRYMVPTACTGYLTMYRLPVLYMAIHLPVGRARSILLGLPSCLGVSPPLLAHLVVAMPKPRRSDPLTFGRSAFSSAVLPLAYPCGLYRDRLVFTPHQIDCSFPCSLNSCLSDAIGRSTQPNQTLYCKHYTAYTPSPQSRREHAGVNRERVQQ